MEPEKTLSLSCFFRPAGSGSGGSGGGSGGSAGERARGAAATMAEAGDAVPPSFMCPISHEVMRDPVTLSDGHSYERTAIERWLTTNDTSPMTGAALKGTDVVPNHALRNSILEHFQAGGRELSPLHPLPPQAAAPAPAREGDELPLDEEAERSLQQVSDDLQTLDEYVSAAARQSSSPIEAADVPSQIARFFRELDVDGSGTLNQTELWRLARKLGSAMTEDDVERAMAEMDPDRSGVVDLQEFTRWWTREPEPEPEPDQEGQPHPAPAAAEASRMSIISQVRRNRPAPRSRLGRRRAHAASR